MSSHNLSLFDEEALPASTLDPVASNPNAPARVQMPNRNQFELRPTNLDEQLEDDHRARLVWAYVERLDLSKLYARIRAVEGGVGRTPIAPEILLSLWLYATLESLGSARALARLCQSHDAYRWLCGGVSVNYRTLAAFRVQHDEMLDDLLSMSVARLAVAGVITMKRVAHDGIRVRASAGVSSLRRRVRLESMLTDARKHVAALKEEMENDPSALSRRTQAARARAAQERERKITAALNALPELEEIKLKQVGRGKKKVSEARASTTDADARLMKMPNGGYNAALNAQLCTDTQTQVIVGVDVTNAGVDQGQLRPMIDQLHRRYERCPEEYLVDGGFVTRDQITAAEKKVRVYAPVPDNSKSKLGPFEPHPTDSAEMAAWRARMGGEAAQEIYKQRASTAECVNAIARQRGLTRFTVRGIKKARCVMMLFALAHNLMRTVVLAPTLLRTPLAKNAV